MKSIRIINIVLIIITLFGCSSVKEIKTADNLKKAVEDEDNVELVTADSAVYRFEKISLEDSSIVGYGVREKSDSIKYSKWNLPLNQIAYIQIRSTNWVKTIIYAASIANIVFSGIPIITAPDYIEPVIKRKEDLSGSCPFVYSWNGQNYSLEGEVIGVALGKRMEYESCIPLTKLCKRDGIIKLKISNERPETHFINKINLKSVFLKTGEELYADNSNDLWGVKKRTKISSAFYYKKDVLKTVNSEDDVYLESDLSIAGISNNYEDELFITIPNMATTDSVALLISAINTDISSVVFEFLQKILGGDYMQFMNACENDEEVLTILKKTLFKSSLKIDFWNNGYWNTKEVIYPVANSVKFRKLAIIPPNNSSSKTIKLRLRWMTDVWKIDALELGIPRLLRSATVELISASHSGKNISNTVKYSDEAYETIIPGENIELKYKVPESIPGYKSAFAIFVKGYLYEWLITNKNLTEKGMAYKETPKLTGVKSLLKNMDYFLPIIYDKWKKLKGYVEYDLGRYN